jgi:hypothetical protein
MRPVFISILIIIVAFDNVEAQNQQEWLQQNRTQRKYLIQQIGALKAFEQSLKIGYQVSTTGLSVIQSIKRVDWNLHHEFFDSKTRINPNISKSKKVASIVELETSILIGIRKLTGQINANTQLTKEDRDHVRRTCAKLKAELAEYEGELIMILNDGLVEMNDNSRIKRIDELYEKLTDEYAFLSHFENNVALLSSQRTNEVRDIEFSKKLVEY